ncbi:hypothetical protein FACS1894162_5650 [Bacteroidia bacterium]|nr:hypothetical protein FACS1894162_5650 [Bacteroidia bacterium]
MPANVLLIKKMIIFAPNYQLKSEMSNFTHKEQGNLLSLFNLKDLAVCEIILFSHTQGVTSKHPY